MKIVISEPIYLNDEYRGRLKTLGDLQDYESMSASNREFVRIKTDVEIVVS